MHHPLKQTLACCAADDRTMQPSLPLDCSPRPAAASLVRMMIRCCRGDGTRICAVDAPADATIRDVKLLLCLPPHNIGSDASELALVSKGKAAILACFVSAYSAPPKRNIFCRQAAFLQRMSLRFLSHRPLRSPPSCSHLVSICIAPSSRRAIDDARMFSEAHCAGHQAASRLQSPALPPAGSPQPQLSAASPASSAALVDGVRVRIEGLRAAPEMNGRTGIVCGVLDCSGRWRVNINADGAKRACVGTFKPENLRVLPSCNFSSEWLGEDGCVYNAPPLTSQLRSCIDLIPCQVPEERCLLQPLCERPLTRATLRPWR